MAGTPTEAELQAQLQKVVDILESTRNFIDVTLAGAGGKWDNLEQIVEGEYTPNELTAQIEEHRALCSNLISSARGKNFILPIVYDYMRLLSDKSGYTTIEEMMKALFEHFVDSSITVKSRGITYGSPNYASGNVGNGTLSRLTVDEYGYAIESVHVEKKTFLCVEDKNNGALEEAEAFEVIGEAQSKDAIKYYDGGSGESIRTIIYSKNAGSSNGGSVLRNSSFSDYDSGGSPKFTGWTEISGSANISQDTTTYYRTHPNATSDASLKMTVGSDIILRQYLEDMLISEFDEDAPYFYRVMYKKSNASDDGTLTITLGNNSKSVDLSSISDTNWHELTLDFDKNLWFKNFNTSSELYAEIKWSGATTGEIYIDDAILCPWDEIDNTYWILRATSISHSAWQYDDKITVEDTDGDPNNGKIQYWFWFSGLGYLPHSSSPTISDP